MQLAALVQLISKVPESIWGAITGSALTLLGVWMTNRHNLKQQRQQFEFESTERQRERQITLRKDVYLSAADTVSSMLSAMAKMLSSDPSSAEQMSAGAQAFSAALTRIQMVAAPDTVRSVAEYQRSFLRTVVAIQKSNYPMMLRKSDIQIAHDARQGYHEERMKCVELMKEYNLTGVHDPDRFRRIEQQSSYASERWAERHSEWLRLTLDQETARLEMAREFMILMTELSRLYVPVLAAIRHELEASEGTELIAEESEKTNSVGLQSMAEIVRLLESSVESIRADVSADEERRRAKH